MKNRKLCCFGAGTLVCLLLLAGSVQAATYNLSDDFSYTNNPNGPWSYGYYEGGTANTWLYTQVLDQVHTSPDWSNKLWTANGGGNGVLIKNFGPNPGTDWGYYEVNQIILAPGELFNGNCPAFARFTAPADMTVDVSALFTGQAPSGTTTDAWVHVVDTAGNYNFLLGSLSLSIDGFYGSAADSYSDRTGTNPSVSYTGQITLQAGDKLEFMVSKRGTGSMDTGLSVTITEVPEPATMSLLGLGGLVTILRKRRS